MHVELRELRANRQDLLSKPDETPTATGAPRRYAGTSLTMIDRVYGHLTVGATANAASRMNAYAERVAEKCVTGASRALDASE